MESLMKTMEIANKVVKEMEGTDEACRKAFICTACDAFFGEDSADIVENQLLPMIKAVNEESGAFDILPR